MENESRALVMAQPKVMMIKNLCPGLQEVGKIKIGKKGVVRNSTGGNSFQPPQKLDHFLVTTLERGSDGNYVVDADIHQQLGEKPKTIPVRLVYDDIALNFPTRYICYYGKKVFCSGDGCTAMRLQKDGTYIERSCPCNRQSPQYAGDNGPNGPEEVGGSNGKGKCKVNGILSVIIDGAEMVGGVWKFRTTSYNTVVGILSSLAMITRITGGRLAGIPLDMRVTPKTVQDPIQGSQQTVQIVSLIYKGTMDTLRSVGYQIAMDEAKHGISMKQIEERAMMLISHAPTGGLGDETDLEVIEEFYPEEAQTVIIMGESGPATQQAQQPLFGDTAEDDKGQQQEQPAAGAPTGPATHHPSGRERGKPSTGKQRRTAAEVEEDRQADERDAQAVQAQEQQTVAQDLKECPCEHPVTRFDGDTEFCEACGVALNEQEQPAPEQEKSEPEPEQPAPAQQQTQAAPAATPAAPAAGAMEDLF